MIYSPDQIVSVKLDTLNDEAKQLSSDVDKVLARQALLLSRISSEGRLSSELKEKLLICMEDQMRLQELQLTNLGKQFTTLFMIDQKSSMLISLCITEVTLRASMVAGTVTMNRIQGRSSPEDATIANLKHTILSRISKATIAGVLEELSIPE